MEKHLPRYKCDTIPNDTIKRMLLDCITGKAQSEIVLLRPDGLAFDSYREFFQELLKKFTHEKDEDRKMNTWPGDRPGTRMLGSIAQTS